MTMEEEKTSGRGGARIDSGRKTKTGERWTEALTVRLSVRGAELLRRAAERSGKSRQQLINEWVMSLTEEDIR